MATGYVGPNGQWIEAENISQGAVSAAGNTPAPFGFAGFAASLLPSLVAGATATRTGSTITVTAAAHGLPALKFDGARVYYPGSPSIIAGWKPNFQRTSANAFTCTDKVSGTVASESVNLGAANTGSVRVAGNILPANSIGEKGAFTATAGIAGGATGATKSMYYTLGGIKVAQPPAPDGVFASGFVAAGSKSAQVGMSGTSGSFFTSADLTKDHDISAFAQVSGASDYIFIASLAAEYVYGADQAAYSPQHFLPLVNPTFTELAPSAVRVICSRLNDGYIYGKHDSNSLYRSSDGGRNWSLLGTIGALGGDAVGLILPAGDGEVLLVGAANLYRTTGWGTGSITRTSVLTSTTAQFMTWGVDTDGAGRCIATHYAASPNFSTSKYVWYSSNSGVTWSVVRDLSLTSENDQHLHFAVFDKYAGGRIYIGHHHEIDAGSGKAIEYSDDNGATWTKLKSINVLSSDGVVRMIQPTVAVVLPEGILLGSDDPDTGLYILRRGDQTVSLFAPGAPETGAMTTRSFATYGAIDPYSGLVYIVWKQQTTGGIGYVMAASGVVADVVFTDSGRFPVSGQTNLPGFLPGFYSIAFTPTEIVGTAVRPSAADAGKNVYWHFRSTRA